MLSATNKVDLIASHEKMKEITLYLVAEVGEWDKKNILFDLQEKINAYAEYIDSGEIWISYPKLKEYKPIILVKSVDSIPEDAIVFLKRAKEILLNDNIEVIIDTLPLLDEKIK